MTEENRREIQIPGGTVRLTEEGHKEHGPTPELQERARQLAAQGQRERKERESATKIKVEDVGRRRAERELEEYRQRRLLLWKQHGGTEEEFDEFWPEMMAEHIREESRKASERFTSMY